ncbi:MAG: hypothetical protein AAFN93_16405 [Bacteroidota bacterium]
MEKELIDGFVSLIFKLVDMLIPFEKMPDHSRVWIYQADRKFNMAEMKELGINTASFLEQWAAHGAALKASYEILHDQFLVLSVDEGYNAASGCSIDSSVHFIQSQEQLLGVNFFDRTKVAFVQNGDVFLESVQNLKSKANSGVITSDVLTFDNLVTNKKEFDERWCVPAKNTWLARYFN